MTIDDGNTKAKADKTVKKKRPRRNEQGEKDGRKQQGKQAWPNEES